MRTAAEFRSRQLELLPMALRRPGAFCGAHGDLYFGTLLRDLFWIDDRPEPDLECIGKLLGGSLGVYGQFHYQPYIEVHSYQNEIASTFAEAAYRLGYLSPTRLLSLDDYDSLQTQLAGVFFETDHMQAHVVEQFGNPSHEVVGGLTTVHCYGCEDPLRPWIHFDYSRCYPPEDGVTFDWFPDEMLRDVRRSENRFELLPFANWFRDGRRGALDE